MEKYIRTKSGDIWELDGKVYRKPNCANYVLPDDSAITDREDEMYRLVKASDVLTFDYGGRQVVEENQVFNAIDLATGKRDEKACISSLWKFNMIYTLSPDGKRYLLQAHKIGENWIVD